MMKFDNLSYHGRGQNYVPEGAQFNDQYFFIFNHWPYCLYHLQYSVTLVIKAAVNCHGFLLHGLKGKRVPVVNRRAVVTELF